MDCFPTEDEIRQYKKESYYQDTLSKIKKEIKYELADKIIINPDPNIESWNISILYNDRYSECLKSCNNQFPEYKISEGNITFIITNEIINKYSFLTEFKEIKSMIRVINEKKYLDIISNIIKLKIKRHIYLLGNKHNIISISTYLEHEWPTENISNYMELNLIKQTLRLFWDFIFKEIKKIIEKEERVSKVDNIGILEFTFMFEIEKM